MSPTEARTAVLESLGEIAPEADLSTLDDSADLREQLDIDSFDFLNVIIAVNERTGVEIPERDYPKVVTLGKFVSYLSAA
jgi:acyl carrier protein